MGRLLRKKIISTKKKKKQENDALSSQIENDKENKLKSKPAVPSAVSSQKKSSIAAKSLSGSKKENYLSKSIQFLREVKAEFKKVTWPSRKQTIGSTMVVIILVMIISLFLGIVDMGLSSLIGVVLQ